MRRPELLAPGGSFLAAYHAIEAGADAVYLGLKEFSARAAAANFTLEQLRRIRGLAGERGKRIYVALNTVIRDEELPRVGECLAWLEALGIDGVIVQDLGVAALARRHFPALVLHASTQTAVHNAAGVRLLSELGFRRVILSRELTLEDLSTLRTACREIELEVFVHGALCYSLSGACLASWALTGRSGNRGECAQICRSVFTEEASEHSSEVGSPTQALRALKHGSTPRAGRCTAPRAGRCTAPRAGRCTAPRAGRCTAPRAGDGAALFSCRDLFLGRDALELARIGIDAFKIEGRMKSPEYAAATVRLYRAVIEAACDGGQLSRERYAKLARDVELAFCREKSTGWLRSSSGSHLIDASYPGHRGAPLGAVERVLTRGSGAASRAPSITLTLDADLSLHDGIALSVPGKREPVAFSVQGLRAGGRRVKFAAAGDSVELELPSDLGGKPASAIAAILAPGAKVRQLSSRSLDLPQPKEGSFAPHQIPVEVALEVRGAAGGLASLLLRVGGIVEAQIEQAVTLDRARQAKPFVEIASPVLAESGGSLFRAVRISATNSTGLADDRIFIPPSQLKMAKGLLFRRLDAAFDERVTSKGREVMDCALREHRILSAPPFPLPLRQSISPKGRAPIPFAWLDRDGRTGECRIEAKSLARIRGRAAANAGVGTTCLPREWVFVPLPTFMSDVAPWIGAMRSLAAEGAKERLVVGLGNLSHIAIAEALSDLRNVSFFVDFHLYVANRWTVAFLARRVPRLRFLYYWIEGVEEDRRQLVSLTGPGLAPVGSSFRPPLFYSRGCFAKHVAGGGDCPPGCRKTLRRTLRQGSNRFELVVRDCMTYLFAARKRAPARSRSRR